MSFDVTTLALAKSYADQHGGGGASTTGDFIIKMTVEGDDNGNYTVVSCDATIEQINAAVSAEKRVVVIAADTTSGVFWEIPIVQAEGEICFFSAFLNGVVIFSYVQKVAENESKWQFVVVQIEAESVSYSNAALPNISTVGGALDELVSKSHTHANKDTLDKLSDANGKLQYNGSDVGAKEQLTGTTSELTPTQVYDAVSAGIPVKVQYLDSTYGLLSFTAFNIAESFTRIVSQTIVYANGEYILAELIGNKSNSIWSAMFTTLAEKRDIPTDDYINSMIDTKLGVIENGSY